MSTATLPGLFQSAATAMACELGPRLRCQPGFVAEVAIAGGRPAWRVRPVDEADLVCSAYLEACRDRSNPNPELLGRRLTLARWREPERDERGETAVDRAERYRRERQAADLARTSTKEQEHGR